MSRMCLGVRARVHGERHTSHRRIGITASTSTWPRLVVDRPGGAGRQQRRGLERHGGEGRVLLAGGAALRVARVVADARVYPAARRRNSEQGRQRTFCSTVLNW